MGKSNLYKIDIKARFDYLGKEEDELEIEFGDQVVALRHYNDGWSYGTNLRTNLNGIYPLSTLLPSYGVHSKFILLNFTMGGTQSLFGMNLIQPAMIAFDGDHIRVESFISNSTASQHKEFIGQVNLGAFSADTIGRIIAEEESGEDSTYYRKVIVCGPSSFNESAYEILVNECGVSQKEISVLGASAFNGN